MVTDNVKFMKSLLIICNEVNKSSEKWFMYDCIKDIKHRLDSEIAQKEIRVIK